MPMSPPEPTNLVLEQLRLMRSDMSALRAEMGELRMDMKAGFSKVDDDISALKKEVRGLKLNTIAEIYKANLTVASFADHEQRIQALEKKAT